MATEDWIGVFVATLFPVIVRSVRCGNAREHCWLQCLSAAFEPANPSVAGAAVSAPGSALHPGGNGLRCAGGSALSRHAGIRRRQQTRARRAQLGAENRIRGLRRECCQDNHSPEIRHCHRIRHRARTRPWLRRSGAHARRRWQLQRLVDRKRREQEFKKRAARLVIESPATSLSPELRGTVSSRLDLKIV